MIAPRPIALTIAVDAASNVTWTYSVGTGHGVMRERTLDVSSLRVLLGAIDLVLGATPSPLTDAEREAVAAIEEWS